MKRCCWLLLLGFLHLLLAQQAVAADLESNRTALKVDVDVRFAKKKYRSGSISDNVQAWLEIVAEDKSDEGIKNVESLKRLHERADLQIRKALMPWGYYSPEIESSLVRKSSGTWRARYKIDTGSSTRVGKVELDMPEVVGLPVDALVAEAQATLQPGKRLRHSRYERAKRELLGQLLALGYLDATFTRAELRVNRQLRTADIDWEVAPGIAYEFGTIKIDQDILRDKFAVKYLQVAEGERFDTSRLIQAQLALNNSNYFDQVTLEIQRDAAVDGRVPVVFHAKPRKRKRYSAGLGFGTDTGPRLSAGLESRRVNRRGHKYQINLRASKIENSVQAEYDIPIKNIASDRWRFSVLAEEAEVGDADAQQYAFGAAREDSWGPLRRRAFLNAERTSFRFGDESSQRSTIVYPGITLSWDRLDNPEFIRRGVSLSATVQGGLGSVGSVTDFVSLSTSARVIRPLSPRMRLLVALDARYLEAQNFSNLPPSQRFFLGGDRSVRGYAFQGISPENASGVDIGGSRAFSGSVEIDYSIGSKWGVALFADAGDVSFGFPDDLQRAVGLGARYRSPVGMIRIDLAHPLDDSSRNVRVHLSIGPDL